MAQATAPLFDSTIRDRAVSLEKHPTTAVAYKRTSAERRPGSSTK